MPGAVGAGVSISADLGGISFLSSTKGQKAITRPRQERSLLQKVEETKKHIAVQIGSRFPRRRAKELRRALLLEGIEPVRQCRIPSTLS